MKKAMTTLLCFALILSLGACTKNDTVPVTEPDEPAAEKVSTVTGVIQDATMNTVIIQTEDGRTLSFSTMDADKTNADGLLIGDTVVISYTGEIDGEDTSGVTVTAIDNISEP